METMQVATATRAPTSLTLLGIPLEIRQDIMLQALHASSDPPSNAEDAQDGRTPMLTSYPYKVTEYKRVYYTRPRNPALPLLLTNKQMYHDAQSMTSLLKSIRPNYTVDVLFVKNVGLWPTWTSVPWLAQQLDTVHATLRVAESPGNLRETFVNQPQMWRAGSGGPPEGVWYFYDALVGFLQGDIGPWPVPGDSEEASGTGPVLTVRKLVLDIQSPGEDVSLPLAHYLGPTPRMLRPMDFFCEHSDHNNPPSAGERFCRFIERYITLLVRSKTFGWELYGRILHERIGTIEIRLDGERRVVFDMESELENAYLAGLNGRTKGKEHRADFRQWKKVTITKRRRDGISSRKV